ncbi:UBA domain-containing protein [Limosilactobacillus reuteri]|uniref:hypothetical protein n=1 Tax=Limosilactobacillus reuteri TaxID=1598 RepID=UPI00206277A8|nr:hypothetical protein [Limosilactobacillus reuteri]UNL37700.1 hypothetical protein G8B26_10935 [Limosilactobacillus reuteri]
MLSDLHRYSVRKNLFYLEPDKKVSKVSMDVIKLCQKNNLTYEETKEALDFANQVLLNKLLNKTTI